MKKFISITLSLLILLFCTTAYADGKLTTVEKNLIVFHGEDTGYFYAKVENTGDAPVSVSLSDLVIFSENDEIILSDSYISTTPSNTIIEPGNYLYVTEFLWDSALEGTKISDYKFSAKAGNSKRSIERIPCEATISLSESNGTDNYIYVTFTNETTEPMFDFHIVAAMYDANETLIFVKSTSLSSISVHPGSTVTAKIFIDSDLIDYYQVNDILPAAVDAIVSYTMD